MVRLPNETIEETKAFLEAVDAEWQKDRPFFYEFAILLGNVHIDFCKEKLSIKHFIAHCDTENTGSYRIMERLGMKRVCVNEGRKNRAATQLSREYQYEM